MICERKIKRNPLSDLQSHLLTCSILSKVSATKFTMLEFAISYSYLPYLKSTVYLLMYTNYCTYRYPFNRNIMAITRCMHTHDV